MPSKTNKPEPDRTELEKMAQVKKESQVIGEFLEWLLSEHGRTITVWRGEGDNGEPRYVWKPGITKAKLDGADPSSDRNPRIADVHNGDADLNPEFCEWCEGYLPERKSIEQMLAEYFEIDLKKVEEERRALLEWMREQNEH